MGEGSPPLKEPVPPSPIPLDSSLRTHPKRLLPPALASTYLHGHLSGHPRTGDQLESFDTRKAEILASMSVDEIEKKYEEVAMKAVKVFEESEKKRKEVEEAIESKKMDRAMERRLYEKFGRKDH